MPRRRTASASSRSAWVTPNTENLQGWASQSSYYQNASGPINKAKLITDLDALVAVPTTFTVTETLGANFSAAALGSPIGTVTTAPGSLTWTATIAGNGSATLDYRATRNGSDVFASTNEVVSTLGLAVSGGTASVTPPAAISIDVLPCGGTPLATTTCTGTACNTSATEGEMRYTVNAGSPPAGTQVSLFSLNTPNPPAGVCPGFLSGTQGAEFDIRPLTTDATFRMVIPQASLGTRQWFQTNVCLGTNLRFITAVSSLANLFPDATFVRGWLGARSLVGSAAEHPAHRLVPGSRVRARAVHREPVAGLGRQRDHHVPRAVRLELDGTDDGRQGRIRPQGLGRLRLCERWRCSIGAGPDRRYGVVAQPGRERDDPELLEEGVPALRGLGRGIAKPVQRGERERFLVAVLDAVGLGDGELQRLARGVEPPATRWAWPSTRLSTGSTRALPSSRSRGRACEPPVPRRDRTLRRARAPPRRARRSGATPTVPGLLVQPRASSSCAQRALEVARGALEQGGLHPTRRGRSCRRPPGWPARPRAAAARPRRACPGAERISPMLKLAIDTLRVSPA